MSAPQFTPGPWSADDDRTMPEVWDASGYAIAELRSYSNRKLGDPLNRIDRSEAETSANANLIAAAPDLYEAACALLDHFDDGTPMGEQMPQVKALAVAAAKARGEP